MVTSAQGASKPNIIVILVDDLGWGDLSCYGAKDLKTPNIDKLAAEGMKLDTFRANCSVCSPTRASLLTTDTGQSGGRTYGEFSALWTPPLLAARRV